MSDLLAQVQGLRKEKGKKGKKARKQEEVAVKEETEEAKQSEAPKKPKVVVMNDLAELQANVQHMQFKNVKRVDNDDDDATETIAHVHEKKKGPENCVIVAPVQMRIDTNDVRNFFSDMAIAKITEETGYYLVEFTSEEDRQKAYKKNKQEFKAGTMLVDLYDVSQEDPQPSYNRGGYGRGGYGNNSQYQSSFGPQRTISVGGKTQGGIGERTGGSSFYDGGGADDHQGYGGYGHGRRYDEYGDRQNYNENYERPRPFGERKMQPPMPSIAIGKQTQPPPPPK